MYKLVYAYFSYFINLSKFSFFFFCETLFYMNSCSLFGCRYFLTSSIICSIFYKTTLHIEGGGKREFMVQVQSAQALAKL